MSTFDNLADANLGFKVAAADRRVEPARVIRVLARERRRGRGLERGVGEFGGVDVREVEGSREACKDAEEADTYLSPLLPGLDVSLSQPVYSMMTFWPTLGMAPVPSERTVLVTPIVLVAVMAGCSVVQSVKACRAARW